MALLCLAAAGCSLVIDIEVAPVVLDQTMPAPAGPGKVALAGTLRVFSAETAARQLADRGPDRIGSIRGVTLTIDAATYDGVDLARTGPPTIHLGDHVLPPGTTSVDLDGAEVDRLRVALLTPTALEIPITFVFDAPDAAAVKDKVHVRLEIQPTLHVDIGKDF